MSIGQILPEYGIEDEAGELIRLNNLSRRYMEHFQTRKLFSDLKIGECFSLDPDSVYGYQKTGDNSYSRWNLGFFSRLVRNDNSIYIVDGPLTVYQGGVMHYKSAVVRGPFKDVPIHKDFAFSPSKIFLQQKHSEDEISWYEYPKGNTVADSKKGTVLVTRKVMPEEMEAETVYIKEESVVI